MTLNDVDDVVYFGDDPFFSFDSFLDNWFDSVLDVGRVLIREGSEVHFKVVPHIIQAGQFTLLNPQLVVPVGIEGAC